jgi:hypothetical protein
VTSYWRAFPWDRQAARGTPLSPSYVPRPTGRGRFDLPLDRSRVLYVAESPEHAVAESLQPWRNRPLRDAHLVRAGRALALVRVELPADGITTLLDLCDPRALVAIRTGPDAVASRRRHRTQPIALTAWDAGHAGLRWWSVFGGDWHGVVLFADRLLPSLSFRDPEPLTPDHPAVRLAAARLGMENERDRER